MTQHSLVIVITGDVEQVVLFCCRVPSFPPDVFHRLLWLSGEEEPRREAGNWLPTEPEAERAPEPPPPPPCPILTAAFQ